MNAFTPGSCVYPATTSRERGAAITARKASARHQANLDKWGPATTLVLTQEQRDADDAKTAQIRQSASVRLSIR